MLTKSKYVSAPMKGKTESAKANGGQRVAVSMSNPKKQPGVVPSRLNKGSKKY